MAHHNCQDHHRLQQQFRREGKYCDVIIQVQGRCFPCHRLVLASGCKYFDSMFGDDFLEKNSARIELKEIDPEKFELLLDFMYCFDEPGLSSTSVLDVLQMSEFFQAYRISTLCIEFIIDNLSQMNLFEVVRVAYNTGNKDLADAALEHIFSRFKRMLKKEDFLRMEPADLKVLLKEFRCRCVPFENENFLLIALIRWVRRSYRKRSRYLDELVQLIGFGRISPKLMEDRVAQPLRTDEHVIEKVMLDVSLRFKCHKNKPEPFEDLCAVDPDSSTNGLHMLLVEPLLTSRPLDRYSYELYSKAESSWSLTRTFFTQFNSLVVCTVLDEPNSLYCLEYAYNNHPRFTVYSSLMDLPSTPSAVLASAPCSRFYGRRNLCGLNNKSDLIYLINDFTCQPWDVAKSTLVPEFDDDSYSRGFYSYKRDVNRWLPVPARPKQLIYSHVLACNDLAFTVGGVAGWETADLEIDMRTVLAYDFREPTWMKQPNSTYLHSRYEPLKSGLSGVLNGTIYALSAQSRTIESFDPTAGKWRTVCKDFLSDFHLPSKWSDLYTSQYTPVVMSGHEDKLYIFGTKGHHVICSIHDPKTEEWQSFCLNGVDVAGKDLQEIFFFK